MSAPNGGSSPGSGAAPTRERLLAAAREVIEEGGYAAASVLAIAERAGLAGGTLYRHFASKEELFVELFRAVGAGELQAMHRAGDALGESASVIDRLEQALATFARRALRTPRLTWALLAEPVDPRVDAERLASRARSAALVAGSLRAAIAAGEIAPLDVEFTAAAIVGGCGEALVGPLAPAADTARLARGEEQLVVELRAFVRRATGARSPVGS